MTTHVEVLDASIQETNLWLKDIQERLRLRNRKLAYQALKATLQAVRDRIGPDNALHLAAQLPLVLKGMFIDGWRPSRTPTRERHLDDFLEHVDRSVFRGLGVEPEAAVRCVLQVLSEHIDPREVEKIAKLFPQEMRELWLAKNSGPTAVTGEKTPLSEISP